MLLVADISQCPGLVEITRATPNWKREMIEKKNRDKIEEYVVRIIYMFNSIHCHSRRRTGTKSRNTLYVLYTCSVAFIVTAWLTGFFMCTWS